MQTAYDVLGVLPTASDEEIRQAYLLRVRLVHPDRHVDGPPEVQQAAEAEFQKVQTAYDLIRTPERRRNYDRTNTAFTKEPEAPHESSSESRARPDASNRPSPPQGPLCQSCGGSPAEQFSFRSVTGFIIVWRWGSLKATLCGGCALASGRDMQATTLTFGWLGVVSAFLTPFVLLGNLGDLDRAARLAQASGDDLRSEKVLSRPGPALAIILLILALAIGGFALANSQKEPAQASQPPTTTTGPPRTFPPVYPWAVGNCVSIPNAQRQVRPVGCDDPHIGFIFAETRREEDCPSQRTDAVIDRRDGRFFCIDEN